MASRRVSRLTCCARRSFCGVASEAIVVGGSAADTGIREANMSVAIHCFVFIGNPRT
jgi:hypothetical protein